ncbi:hypothetical protein D3C84_1043960 [compost metagenome]
MAGLIDVEHDFYASHLGAGATTIQRQIIREAGSAQFLVRGRAGVDIVAEFAVAAGVNLEARHLGQRVTGIQRGERRPCSGVSWLTRGYQAYGEYQGSQTTD